MELNYKMICILEILFGCEGNISIYDLMTSLDITRRVLTYNIEKVNDFLDTIGASPIEVTGGQVIFSISEKDLVQKAISNRADLCYVMSKEERRVIMYLSFALEPDKVTIENLTDLLEVSRNTVVSEIADLKEYLFAKEIKLVNYTKRGYSLEGDETAIRFHILDFIYNSQSEKLQTLIKKILYDAVENTTGQKHTTLIDDTIKKIVEDSEQYTEAHFNYNSLNEVVQYLLIILVRAAQRKHPQNNSALIDTAEYAASGIILKRMNEIHYYIPQEEQFYVTMILLASKVYDTEALITEETMHIREFAEDLINTFSAKACVRFANYDEFIERLLLHVRPMFYRLRYHIKVKNVLTKEIKSKYRELYNLTDLAVKTIQQKYNITVPDEEIAYLCVYIGGWMNRQTRPQNSGGMPRILIVCGAGIGTSLLLKQQISTLLGNGYLYETKDERETNCADATVYQLIVSTIKLGYSGSNVITVNPILTMAQQNQLLTWSAAHADSADDYKVVDILEIVKNYADIKNEPQLINALLGYFTFGKKPEPVKKMGMRELLKQRHIKIISEQVNDVDAIRCSCEELIKDGVVKVSYPQSILEIIDSLGLYSEIASGILLAHGKPSEEACGVGITITLLRQPVIFHKWDKKISVIFTLATKDNQAHLDILRDIMKILSSTEVCSKLTACQFDSEQEVYHYICKVLN